jgi:hypothetical protein
MPYPFATATKSPVDLADGSKHAPRAAKRRREFESMTEQLTAEHFLPHLSKTFRVRDGRHCLTLARVETDPGRGAAAQAGTRQPFNLIFRGPPRDVLPEGLYTLAVDDGPDFALYVMPIHTPTPDGQEYQSLFN